MLSLQSRTKQNVHYEDYTPPCVRLSIENHVTLAPHASAGVASVSVLCEAIFLSIQESASAEVRRLAMTYTNAVRSPF